MTVSRFQLRPACVVLFFFICLLPVCSGCGGSGPGPDDTAGGKSPQGLYWPGPDGAAGNDREGCAPVPTSSVRGGSFVIALVDSVRPRRAPLPDNASERLVFAQLYETLTRVACGGRMQTGLAEAWEVQEDGAIWIFTLRPGARLWDGTPVTAEVVMEAWRRNAGLGETAHLGILPLQTMAREDGRLEVRPAVPTPVLPRLLAHPAWAVALPRSGWTWPVGSGPARLRASTPAPLPDLVCKPNPQHPSPPRWKQILWEVRPGMDARDLVGLDADLMVVRRLAAVDFYRELGEYGVVPLPWDRLYLLACPPGADGQGMRRWRDAARGLAPGTDLTTVAAVPWTWPTLPGGESGAVPLGAPTPPPNQSRLDSKLARARLDSLTVIHPASDPAAAELSGRLAALAGRPARTVGLDTEDFDAALDWRMAGACVLPVHPGFTDPALQLARLTGRRSWLAEALRNSGSGDSLVAAERGAGAAVTDLVERGLLLPLAVSRPWLVHRGPLAGLELDGDGTLRLTNLGVPAVEALP